MANAALSIINSAGTVLISDKNPTLAFIQKGTTTLSTFVPATSVETAYYKGTISLPPGYECVVIAIRTAGYVWQIETDGATTYRAQTSGTTITWYMFARPKTTPAGSGVGLQIFDVAGKCTFDSSLGIGKIVSSVEASVTTNGSGAQTIYTGAAFPGGKTYAMVPYSYTERINQVGTNVRYFSSEFNCNTSLNIREYLYIAGSSDTSDAGIWGSAATLLVDVTGF